MATKPSPSTDEGEWRARSGDGEEGGESGGQRVAACAMDAAHAQDSSSACSAALELPGVGTSFRLSCPMVAERCSLPSTIVSHLATQVWSSPAPSMAPASRSPHSWTVRSTVDTALAGPAVGVTRFSAGLQGNSWGCCEAHSVELCIIPIRSA